MWWQHRTSSTSHSLHLQPPPPEAQRQVHCSQASFHFQLQRKKFVVVVAAAANADPFSECVNAPDSTLEQRIQAATLNCLALDGCQKAILGC